MTTTTNVQPVKLNAMTQIYRDKLIPILCPKGYLLQNKETKLVYGSVSLEDGRKQDNYTEVEEILPDVEPNS